MAKHEVVSAMLTFLQLHQLQLQHLCHLLYPVCEVGSIINWGLTL
jgi:hypothetical protein